MGISGGGKPWKFQISWFLVFELKEVCEEFSSINVPFMSEFKLNALTYIPGYVVKMLKRNTLEAVWDAPLFEAKYIELLNAEPEAVEKARILAVVSENASDWLKQYLCLL